MIVARHLVSERSWLANHVHRLEAEHDDARRDLRVAQGHVLRGDEHARIGTLREAAQTGQCEAAAP